MDVNFVDPPVPSDWSVFEPSIGEERAASALSEIGGAMGSNEVLTTAFSTDQLEPLIAAVKGPEVAPVYASGIPMIARFLTIELDTEHEIGKGIGRVAPGDPPPRFGDKYKRKLPDPAVAAETGQVLENLALHGFAAAAAHNSTLVEPGRLEDRDLAERWRIIVASLSPTWHHLLDLIKLDEQNPNPLSLLVFGITHPAGDDYIELAQRLGLGKRRPFGTTRMVTYFPYFMALGWALFTSGTDLVRRQS